LVFSFILHKFCDSYLTKVEVGKILYRVGTEEGRCSFE